MFNKWHAVNEVFTPRRNDVNREIYVDWKEADPDSFATRLAAIIYFAEGDLSLGFPLGA